MHNCLLINKGNQGRKLDGRPGAIGLLKRLEGGLKHETFSDGWARQKSGRLGALTLVK